MHGCVVLLVLAATILRVVCFYAYNQQEHFDKCLLCCSPASGIQRISALQRPLPLHVFLEHPADSLFTCSSRLRTVPSQRALSSSSHSLNALLIPYSEPHVQMARFAIRFSMRSLQITSCNLISNFKLHAGSQTISSTGGSDASGSGASGSGAYTSQGSSQATNGASIAPAPMMTL